jgi:hypothetical protein
MATLARPSDDGTSLEDPVALEENFSLVLGGPLFQLLCRGRLSNDALGLLHRRIALGVLVAWAPLLVLSALQGGLTGPGLTMSFMNDYGVNLRFLVVVPLLLAAELIVHWRLRPLIEQFRARGLVRPDQDARFARALSSAKRWRNSILAEVILIAFVYVAGTAASVRRYAAFGATTWYTTSGPAGEHLSQAGLWFVFVSLPLFQFLLLRWYFRLFIWARFLWQVSRLDLDLNATHPDKAGGLGFLGASLAAFVPIAAAHGVLVAGMLADRIFYAGAKLVDYKLEIAGLALFLVVLFAGPLTVFGPMLARVKRSGLRQYGALGQDYVRDFRAKWMAGSAPSDEPLIGTGDIQSLADLGNSYAVAEQMRFFPISRSALLVFVVAFLVPILPLVLTIVPAEQLIDKLVGMVL